MRELDVAHVQRGGHFAHGVRELADLIVQGDRQALVVGPAGDGARGLGERAQRHGDVAAYDPGSDKSQQHREGKDRGMIAHGNEYFLAQVLFDERGEPRQAVRLHREQGLVAREGRARGPGSNRIDGRVDEGSEFCLPGVTGFDHRPRDVGIFRIRELVSVHPIETPVDAILRAYAVEYLLLQRPTVVTGDERAAGKIGKGGGPQAADRAQMPALFAHVPHLVNAGAELQYLQRKKNRQQRSEFFTEGELYKRIRYLHVCPFGYFCFSSERPCRTTDRTVDRRGDACPDAENIACLKRFASFGHDEHSGGEDKSDNRHATEGLRRARPRGLPFAGRRCRDAR